MNTDWIDEHIPTLSRYSLSVMGKFRYFRESVALSGGKDCSV